jgi:hypothetical protein
MKIDRLEIHGRDVVACRPAPNGGPFFPKGSLGQKKEKKILKRMDPAIAGHPGNINVKSVEMIFCTVSRLDVPHFSHSKLV